MIEIAAMAFNKIVLLFFYNIKHLKFQSSNTMIIDQTRIHTSITELLECNIKNLFFTHHSIRRLYTTTFHEGQIKKMNDFLKIFSQIHLWITENPDDHVVIKVQMIISNWSKMFPKRSF